MYFEHHSAYLTRNVLGLQSMPGYFPTLALLNSDKTPFSDVILGCCHNEHLNAVGIDDICSAPSRYKVFSPTESAAMFYTVCALILKK